MQIFFFFSPRIHSSKEAYYRLLYRNTFFHPDSGELFENVNECILTNLLLGWRSETGFHCGAYGANETHKCHNSFCFLPETGAFFYLNH